MKRRKTCMTLLAAPALLATMGPTNCQHFAQTTVPASDTTAPIIGTRMFFFGEEELGLWPLYRETSNPDAVWVIYPFGFDGGGIRRVQMGHGISVYCVDQTGISAHFASISETQTGGPGSLVSNGIYLDGGARSFDEWVGFCDQVDEIVYSWSISAEDFHGNVTADAGGQIVFLPE